MAHAAKKTIDVRDAYASIRQTDEWPTEADVDYADSVLRASYYKGVTLRAKGFIDDLKRGEYGDDLDSFREGFEQAIDGDHDVIYTACARTIEYISDYASDARDEWGDMGSEKPPTHEQIAYLCLKYEVWEEIESQLEMSVEEWFEEKDSVSDDSKESDD